MGVASASGRSSPPGGRSEISRDAFTNASAATALGISPAELIRMAVEHELAGSNRRMERAAMAKALQAKHGDPDYEQEFADPGSGLRGLPT